MLARKQFADRFQFPPTFRGCFGVRHLKLTERIDDNVRDNQPSILLIVGGNDIPGCMLGARRAQASLKGLPIIRPVFSFVNVRQTEFPVFVWLVDAFEEAFPLFVL